MHGSCHCFFLVFRIVIVMLFSHPATVMLGLVNILLPIFAVRQIVILIKVWCVWCQVQCSTYIQCAMTLSCVTLYLAIVCYCLQCECPTAHQVYYYNSNTIVVEQLNKYFNVAAQSLMMNDHQAITTKHC